MKNNRDDIMENLLNKLREAKLAYNKAKINNEVRKAGIRTKVDFEEALHKKKPTVKDIDCYILLQTFEQELLVKNMAVEIDILEKKYEAIINDKL